MPSLFIGVTRAGYLSMGGQGVEEAYITARVPSLDYEITDTPIQMPGGPEEVREEDDIPPGKKFQSLL